MSLSDPIADMLTRIRNGLRARMDMVNILASGTCEGICRVLKEEGYVLDVKRIEDTKQGLLRIYLKYGPAVTSRVGVLSFVMLSVADAPRSLPA